MKPGYFFLWCTLWGFGAYAQQPDSLYGHIFSYEGEAQIGAGIHFTDSYTGTITDLDGAYRLALPTDAVSLKFSNDGYLSLETELLPAAKLDVILGEYWWHTSLDAAIKSMKRYRRKHGDRFFFKGRLLDRHNQPLANTPIQVENGEEKVVRTDVDGWFTIFAPLRAKGVLIFHTQSPTDTGDSASSPLSVIARVIY